MGPLLMLFAIYTAVFLIGMFMMKAGFYTLSGHRLKRWLMRFTATPWQAFLTGLATTALVQSSSAVMVMTVGLVATRYLSFRQSIGIILGSNIGSTITTELITLDIGDGAIPFLLGGALLVFIGRHRLVYSLGMIAVGLAALLFAMDGFSSLAKPLASYPLVDAWLQQTNGSTAIGLLVGIILTALVHSSAATIGIAMGFFKRAIVDTASRHRYFAWCQHRHVHHRIVGVYRLKQGSAINRLHPFMAERRRRGRISFLDRSARPPRCDAQSGA